MRSFQFSYGIQTSKRITESDVGWRVPTTRQNAGIVALTDAGTCVASPDEITEAAVIEVSVSWRDLSEEQSVIP